MKAVLTFAEQVAQGIPDELPKTPAGKIDRKTAYC